MTYQRRKSGLFAPAGCRFTREESGFFPGTAFTVGLEEGHGGGSTTARTNCGGALEIIEA